MSSDYLPYLLQSIGLEFYPIFGIFVFGHSIKSFLLPIRSMDNSINSKIELKLGQIVIDDHFICYQ